MKRLYSAAILLLAASSVTEAAFCSSKTDPQVVQSAEYLSCKKATGIDFTGTGRSTVDPLLFCGSADCHTLWAQLERIGDLQCLQGYDAGEFRLNQDTSSGKCFAKYGNFATPAPATTDATAAKTMTASSPTVTSTAGGGSTPSVTASTSSSTSTATSSATTPSSGTAPTPGTVTAATALSQESSTGSKTTATSESDRGLDTGSLAGDTAGSQKRDATNEDGTLTTTTNTNTNVNASPKNSDATSANRSEASAPSSPSSGSSTVPSTGTSTGAKSGSSVLWIAMGSGVAVVVLVAIGLVFVRGPSVRPPERRKGAYDVESGAGYVATLHSSRSRHSSSGSISILGSSPVTSRAAVWDDETIEAIRIPFEKITIGVLVSRGGFGEVYRGMYRNQAVAIKKLLPERRQDMGQIRNFFAEIKLMAVLEHEHIVQLVGVAWDSLSELCVVSEFMSRGDLRSLLVQYQAKESIHPRGFSPDKIKIALHVAHALTYMHSLPSMVLHRDLKSRNILLNDSLVAKITDFGVSRERADSTMTIGVGSSLWMAPEVMTGGRYDDKADVFSFGVVLSELATHTLPYSHAMEPGFRRRLPDAVVVQMMSTGRLTVEFTDKSPMAELGRSCVALDPSERPSAAEVQHQIHQIWRGSTTSE